MSRIFGFSRSADAALADDHHLAVAALRSLPGDQYAVRQMGGTTLGRSTVDNGDLAGGLVEQSHWIVAVDGTLLNGENGAEEFARLLERYGPESALQRTEGDFAAIAFDRRERRLLLMRDRLGVKPLYWVRLADGVGAASQPRALLPLIGQQTEINREFVARFAGMHYRTFDNRPEESPYHNVHQVPAGSYVDICGDASPVTRRYWSLTELPDHTGTVDELAERYRSLLFDAVGRRMKHSRRPVFTLSGGLDSSSVICCAIALSGAEQNAISSVYGDPTYDERHEIRDVVDGRNIRWHPLEVHDDLDLFALVQRMVRMHDEPVATATWLSHLLVTEWAAQAGFSVLYGGLGGDELNAGEYEYFPFFFADLAAAGGASDLAPEFEAWSRHHDHPVHRKSTKIGVAMMERLTDPEMPGRCLPDLVRLHRYAATVNPDFVDLSDFRPDMPAPFSSYLKNRTFQDMFFETLPCCLRAEDRQCTAAGMQHFDPFLDHHVVEFMYRVPGSLKIHRGVTKQLLRAAMRDVLPEATRTRVAKVGWNAPAHVWFKGRNLANLRDLVASRKFRERGIYVVREVQRLIDEHVEIVDSRATRENHMMFLWQLVNLELWLQSISMPTAEPVS